MECIKDLGVREVLIKSGVNTGKTKKKRYGLFKCPSCGATIEHVMYTGKKRNSCGAKGCKSTTSNKYGHRKIDDYLKKSNQPYFSLFNDFYNRAVKGVANTVWNTYSEFEADMYADYIKVKQLGIKSVTLYVEDHSIISKANTYFTDASKLSYRDFSKDIVNNVYHSARLATELGIPHNNIVKSISRMDPDTFGEYAYGPVTEYGYISKPIKTILLSKEQYHRVRNKIVDFKNNCVASNVYIIKCSNVYKIGIASDVTSRFNTLKGANAFPIELVDSYPITDAAKIEKELHNKYKEFNTHHEWFNLTDAQVKEIITYLDSIK